MPPLFPSLSELYKQVRIYLMLLIVKDKEYHTDKQKNKQTNTEKEKTSVGPPNYKTQCRTRRREQPQETNKNNPTGGSGIGKERRDECVSTRRCSFATTPLSMHLLRVGLTSAFLTATTCRSIYLSVCLTD